MIKIYSQKQWKKANSYTKLPLICNECKKKFFRSKKDILNSITRHRKSLNLKCFCSLKCNYKNASKKIKLNCNYCSKEIVKIPSEIKKSKTKRFFCNSSCAAKYNNFHKTKGYRRSKLEVWIEKKLIILMPNLKILFNDKKAIGSELDIYIPSLNLAIEINGIFHYKPIYGDKKLKQIRKNDLQKKKLSIKNNIKLIIINVSNMNNFNKKNGQIYLNKILSLIIKNKIKDDIYSTL